MPACPWPYVGSYRPHVVPMWNPVRVPILAIRGVPHVSTYRPYAGFRWVRVWGLPAPTCYPYRFFYMGHTRDHLLAPILVLRGVNYMSPYWSYLVSRMGLHVNNTPSALLVPVWVLRGFLTKSPYGPYLVPPMGLRANHTLSPLWVPLSALRGSPHMGCWQ